MSAKSKKALLDLEFLVNLIRGLIVLVVIFFLAAAVYNIFFQNNEEEVIKQNFLGLIDTIENMPPNFGPILYSIDLGDVDEYSIINSLGSSSLVNIEDPLCTSSDCLCLCNGRRDECETPILCKRVKSKIDNTILSFAQYRFNKAPYVEISTREYHKENKKFPSVMLKRANNEVAICDAEACKSGYYCDCFVGIDGKTSLQTIENLKNAILKCSLEAQGISNELEQEAISIYEGLAIKPRIYYYPIESNYELKEDLVEVYELNKGIPNKIETYALETEAGKFKWLGEAGYSHNLLEMFRMKLENPNKGIIFCDQINDNLQTDYSLDLGEGYSIESGYCMMIDNTEQIPFWEDKVEKVNDMIQQGKELGEYYFEIPLPEEETIGEDNQEVSDNSYSDDLDAGIAESNNNYMYELRLDNNIKPYIRIKKSDKIIYSNLIPNQDGPNTYILPDFNVLNIKVFKVNKDSRNLLYFTPNIFPDNTHSFVSLFSLTEEKKLDIYDEENEINDGVSKIKLNILQNKIQETVKGNKLGCNEPVANTLIASNGDKSKGWNVLIKKDIASLEYTGPEKDNPNFKTIGKKQYPLNLNCYVDHLGNYHGNVDQILITPLDKDIAIVKLESGEVCLHKKSDIFFKGK